MTLPKNPCIQVPWKYFKVCGYSDPFFKNLNQRSLTPRWPLTPKSIDVTWVTLPKDHCVQVQWKYIKVCGYSDPFFKNSNQGHRPLDDLWPHICWGYMHDSTQGSLCPSPMGIYPWIYQCMWIQWSILQNLTKITTYYILHTYYIRTYVHTHIHTHTYIDTYIHTNIHTHLHTYYVQKEWSHSLFLNKVQARQKDRHTLSDSGEKNDLPCNVDLSHVIRSPVGSPDIDWWGREWLW